MAKAKVDGADVLDRTLMLTPARLVEKDFAWRSWGATVPEFVIDKIEDGRLWRLCSRRVQRGDRIQWRNRFVDAIWRALHRGRCSNLRVEVSNVVVHGGRAKPQGNR